MLFIRVLVVWCVMVAYVIGCLGVVNWCISLIG